MNAREEMVERMRRLHNEALGVETRRFLRLAGPRAVTEATFSRLLQHTNSHVGYMILSADRADRVPIENAAALTPRERDLLAAANNATQSLLREKLRALGFSYIPVRGASEETHPKTGDKSVVSEQSFFIPNVPADRVQELAALAFSPPFNQDSILRGDPVEGIVYLKRDGTREKIGSYMDVDSIAQYFTQIKPTTTSKVGIGKTPRSLAPRLTAKMRAGEAQSGSTFLGLLYEASNLLDRDCWFQEIARLAVMRRSPN